MRKYTLALSIAAHAILVCAAIVVPVIATTAVPRPIERLRVTLAQPEMPAAPRVRRLPPTRVINPDAAPVVEPDVIAPEVPSQPGPRFDIDETAGLTNTVPGSVSGLNGGLGGEPPPPAPPVKPREPVRVGSVIRRPEKVHHVNPIYPPIALAARLEGVVILEALLGEDGSVRDVRVLRSTPLLDSAAIDAVRQWQFRPTTLNGQPVPVLMTVTVRFALDR